MSNTLVVVNGEEYWAEHFSEYEVYRIRLQTSRWMLRDGLLWVYDAVLGKRIRVDSLFWRIGAVRPFPHHREALELVRYAQVPCVNSAETLLRGFDRLNMLNELREIGLPVVPFTAVVGPPLMGELEPQLPSIIKVGSYHAGYGKMKLTTLEQWQDMVDFIFITEDYFTIEPYIDYVRDIRCVAVGEQVWAMARNGSRWKANSGVVETQLIAAPDELYDYTLRAMRHLGADILALDFLETREGQYVVLEGNDVPGLTGFPDSVTFALVERMKAKIEAAGS
jgi:ribosomal protein S6--L-glutamate ligase